MVKILNAKEVIIIIEKFFRLQGYKSVKVKEALCVLGDLSFTVKGVLKRK